MADLPSNTVSRLDWALWYAAQGWPVFPCTGKRPLTPHGFQDATCDVGTIQAWWQQWPQANIATPTGVGGRIVLDIDPRNGGDNTLAALERQHGQLPSTPIVHTGGGGTHYYLIDSIEGGIPHHHKGLGEGIDVQGRGGYVILPPSIHPENGKPYLWDLLADLTQPIAEVPFWVEALCPPSRTSPDAPGVPTTAAGTPIPDGMRESTLVRLGSALRHAGGTYDEILAALTVANLRCVPPLEEEAVLRVSRSVTRYQVDATLHIRAPDDGEAKQGQVWASPPASAGPLTITDLADMLERTYPLPQWLIKGLIPEGLTFFVGSPKSSKTYLAYSLALSLAVATSSDGLWLEHYPIHLTGPVVYITLEDDEADSRLRIAELAPWLTTVPRERFLFLHGFDLPRFDEGLVDVLREQIIERYHPALVVIDPISYLYAPLKKGADQFGEVKDMLLPLRWLGKTYHCGILGIDHRRKKNADDVDIFETTYGSNAKIAVADALLMVVREDKEVTLHARVRKGQDQTLTLQFEFAQDGTARWLWKGSTDGIIQEGNYGDLRRRIIEALSGVRLAMTVRDLLAALDIPDSRQMRQNVDSVLRRAIKSGEVQRTTRGAYIWVEGG